MKTIILEYKGTYKDGGSKRYLGDDNKHYWQDFSISSKRNKTEGKLYLGDINDKNPQLALGKFVVKKTIKTPPQQIIIQ